MSTDRDFDPDPVVQFVRPPDETEATYSAPHPRDNNPEAESLYRLFDPKGLDPAGLITGALLTERRNTVAEIRKRIAAFQKPAGWSELPPPWLNDILNAVSNSGRPQAPTRGPLFMSQPETDEDVFGPQAPTDPAR